MKRALNYNEKKVEQGKAELIHAGNFLQLPEELKFYQKLERFENLMNLNQRAETKVIHLSLNFHPDDEPKLNKDFLKQISEEYMQKLGFGNQPYLVYQHHDSGHPHVHIVSTMIRNDGSRINTHNLGRDVSKPVSQELEKKYGLVNAEKQQQVKQPEHYLKVDPQKVEYGKSETKRSITNVLNHVIDQYKYTSVAELNAILRQYNVTAERGHEDGRIFKNRGLLYQALDESGNKIGIPIKASSIHNRPTLDKVEERCKSNESKREPTKQHLKTAIEWAMHKEPRSLEELARELQRERIAIVVRRSEEGKVYGLTYIDHPNKSVFNGSNLGKEYSAKRMLERLNLPERFKDEQEKSKDRSKTTEKEKPTIPKTEKEKQTNRTIDRGKGQLHEPATGKGSKGIAKIIEQLIEPANGSTSINRELSEEEKRRRKRQQEMERN